MKFKFRWGIKWLILIMYLNIDLSNEVHELYVRVDAFSILSIFSSFTFFLLCALSMCVSWLVCGSEKRWERGNCDRKFVGKKTIPAVTRDALSNSLSQSLTLSLTHTITHTHAGTQNYGKTNAGSIRQSLRREERKRDYGARLSPT